MLDSYAQFSKISIRSQLIELIDRLPEDFQLKLMHILEAKLPKRFLTNWSLEKRGNLRKNCLVKVNYVIQDTPFKSFILDVGAFGVFVETDNAFPVEEEVLLIFTLPNHPEPFHVSGDIVWSGPQGFGARFKYLTHKQKRIITAFSEKEMDVYEINT